MFGDRIQGLDLNQNMINTVESLILLVGGPFADETTEELDRLKRTMTEHKVTNKQFDRLVGQDAQEASTSITVISREIGHLLEQQWMNTLWLAGLLTLEKTKRSLLLVDKLEDTLQECHPLLFDITALYPILFQCGVLTDTTRAKWVEDLLTNKSKDKSEVRDTSWEKLTRLVEAVYDVTGKDITRSSNSQLLQQATQGSQALSALVTDGWRLAAPDGSLADGRVAAAVYIEHNHEQSTVLPLSGTSSTNTRAEQW